jgi:hypothetical protein
MSTRRRSNRDRTLPTWIATAANAFGPEYERLISRAICLTGDLSHIKWVWLASQAVPDGVGLMEAASQVRVVRRWVIVPRSMRERMVKQINDCGWRAAYNVLHGDDLVVVSGWDWQHPKLPGSPVIHPRELVDDVCLLKGWRSRGDSPQHKRRTTLTLFRLNKIVTELGVWADDPRIELPRSTDRPAFGLAPSPKDDMRDFGHVRGLAPLGNRWGIVGDHHDIAPPRREEEYECRHIARHLGFNAETEQRRIEGLNDRHRAWLESITGKTIEVEDYTGDGHAVGDMADQTAAMEMTFEHVGHKIEDRRNRENEFLEPTEKLLTKGKRKGKTYRPNKAGPCRTLVMRGIRLDGWASWHALFDASYRPSLFGRPPKKGSQYFDKLKPTAPKERGLFGSWRTAPIEVYSSDFKCEQELQDTQSFDDLSARRSRRQLKRDVREIIVPEGWDGSYAEELMTLTAKKPIPHEYGVIPFGWCIHYSDGRTLVNPALYDRSRFREKRIPYHESYAIEQLNYEWLPYFETILL